jgi:hypothetical protein
LTRDAIEALGGVQTHTVEYIVEGNRTSVKDLKALFLAEMTLFGFGNTR